MLEILGGKPRGQQNMVVTCEVLSLRILWIYRISFYSIRD